MEEEKSAKREISAYGTNIKDDAKPLSHQQCSTMPK